MNRLSYSHCYFAVDSRPGIPSRAVIASINIHRDYIVGAEFHKWGRIDAERHITIIPFAGQLPVDINLRKRHYAVEIKIYAFARVGLVELKALAIPALRPTRAVCRRSRLPLD